MTGHHRGPKQKLPAGYTVPSLLWTSCPKRLHYNAMCFLHRVWYHTLFLHCACIRSSGIILIPQATFVPNFVSCVASIAELAYGEQLCTQSITHSPSLFVAPGTKAFASEYEKLSSHWLICRLQTLKFCIRNECPPFRTTEVPLRTYTLSRNNQR